jgi:opacity protein-like surface antigen
MVAHATTVAVIHARRALPTIAYLLKHRWDRGLVPGFHTIIGVTMRRTFSGLRTAAAAALLLLLAHPRPACADGTVFYGSTLNPAAPVRGVALGLTILVVGLEFEYTVSPEDAIDATPARHEGSASVLVQTPTGRIRLYGVAGVGLYRERLAGQTVTDGTLTRIGGGVKITLAGPLALRLDYRVTTTGRQVGNPSRQRVYAGLNVGF